MVGSAKHLSRILSYATVITSMFIVLAAFIPRAEATIANGENALDAIGQVDSVDPLSPQPVYTKSAVNGVPNRQGFGPKAMAFDSVHHRFFLADTRRVLVYNLNTDNTFIDRLPDNVLGQANFDSNFSSVNASSIENPTDLAYDAVNNRLFVVDNALHRVEVFDVTTITNGQNAVNVLGQPNLTSNTPAITQNGLTFPFTATYDSVNNRLFVAEFNGNRVLVFDTASITNGENAINVLGQANFTSSGAAVTQSGIRSPISLAYDGSTSRLFVVENNNNRVTVFDATTSTITNGENASNVLGSTIFTSAVGGITQAKFSFPVGSAFDSVHNRLFISDSNRVVVFDTAVIVNGENAINVLGEPDFTTSNPLTSIAGMSNPGTMSYDATNNRLLVSDVGNNRVTMYDVATITNGKNAMDLLGQYDGTNLSNPLPIYTKSGFGDSPNRLGFNGPNATALDTVNHRLFLADTTDNRVLVYNLTTTNTFSDRIPDVVLGQADFVSKPSLLTQASLLLPQGLAYDGVHNRLFVADTSHHRIMVYDASVLTNGKNAANVLGQANFTTANPLTTQAGLRFPARLAYDSVHDRLFVVDTSNQRVVVFDVATITDGKNAANVLGQANFISSVVTTTQSGMFTPTGVAYDGTNNRLFVADLTNNRVMVFDVATITDGKNATNVLGQANFTSGSSNATQAGMNSPVGLAYEEGHHRLFVAQSSGKRVTVYDVTTIANGENAINVLGQATFTGVVIAATQAGMDTARDVAYDSGNDRLVVVDSGNNRATVYDTSVASSALAYPAGTPTVSNPTASTLALVIATSNNTSSTTYAIFNTTLSTYVAANGSSNGVTAVYFTSSSWNGTVTGLAINTAYQFSVIARNTDNIDASTSPVSSAVVTLANSAATPTVSNPTISSLALTLGTNSNPASVTYAMVNVTTGNYVAASGASNGATPVFFTSSSWTGTVTGLSINTSYQFSVVAQNSAGVNAATSSASTAVFTLANPASAPSISNPTTSTLALTLNTSGNPANTTYAIFNATAGTYVGATGSSNGTTPVFFASSSWAGTVSGLTSNTSYQFSVVARNSNGVNAATSSQSTATSTSAISALIPGTPSISNPTTSTLQIVITTNGNDPTVTYTIFNSTANNYLKADGNSNGSTPIFFSNASWNGMAIGLSLNTSYQFSVTAKSSDNVITATSTLSTGIFTLANLALAPTVSNPTTSTLQLVINPNSNPANTTYAIFNATGNYVTANGSSSGAAPIFFTNASWTGTVTGLISNTPYQFNVISRNGDGVNTATSSVSALISTSAVTANAPGTPTVSNPTISTVDVVLSTNGNTSSTTYALYNATNATYSALDGTSNGSTPAFFTAASWNGTVKNLNVNTSYQFAVTAKSIDDVVTVTSSLSNGVFTLVSPALAPAVSNPTTSTLQLVLATNGNSANTTYAIFNSTVGDYVAANGSSNGTAPVFFTNASWGGTITGLTPNTSYQFSVIARNGDAINAATSSLSGATSTIADTALTPGAPIVSSPTTSSIQIVIATNGNDPAITYALFNLTTGTYLTALGEPSLVPVFFTSSTWNDGLATGLNPNTSYQFAVIAKSITNILTPTSTASAALFTLANPAGTPVVSDPTTSTLRVVIDTNGNSSSTLYAIFNVTRNTYLAADGISSGSIPIFFSSSSWNGIVPGLTSNTFYQFVVRAQNGDAVNTATSSVSLAVSTLSQEATTPGVPAVSNPTLSSIDLAIVTNGNVSSTTYAIYNVTTGNYLAADGSSNGGSAVFFTNSSWGGTVTGLNINTAYQFVALAQSSDLVVSPSSSVSNVFYTLANPGLTPTVSNPTISSLDLTWGDNGNPSSTVYALFNDTAGTYVEVDGSTNGSTPSFFTLSTWVGTVRNLISNTSYQFSVIAQNGDGLNAVTSSISLPTATLPLPAGTPTARNPTTSTLDVVLDTVGNSSGTTYAVLNSTTNEYLLADGSANGGVAAFFPASDWNGVVGNLALDTSYQFEMISSDGVTSTASAPVFTLANAAGAPMLSNATTSTLELSLDTNGNPSTTLFALYNTSSEEYLKNDGTSNGTTIQFFTDIFWNGFVRDLLPGTSYQFTALVKNADGVFAATSSPSNSLITFSLNAGLPVVSNPTTSTLQIILDTSAESPGTTFAIFNLTTNTYLKADGTSNGSVPVLFATATWNGTAFGLAPNTSYQFEMITSDNVTSSPSNALFTLANVPTNLVASSVTGQSLELSWSGDATDYYAENTTAGIASGWVTSTSYTFGGLGCNATYFFRVKGRNGDGVETAFSTSTLFAVGNCSSGGPGLTVGLGGVVSSSFRLPLGLVLGLSMPTFPVFGWSLSIPTTTPYIFSFPPPPLVPVSNIKFITLPIASTLRPGHTFSYTYSYKNPSSTRQIFNVTREVRSVQGNLLMIARGSRTLRPSEKFSFTATQLIPKTTKAGKYTLLLKIVTPRGKIIDKNSFGFEIKK